MVHLKLTSFSGKSPTFLREMLEEVDPFLVSKYKGRKTVAGLGMNKAKYNHTTMYIMGVELFRGIKLKELNKHVLITSFLLDNEAEGDQRSWEYKAYHNVPQRQPPTEPAQRASFSTEGSKPVDGNAEVMEPLEDDVMERPEEPTNRESIAVLSDKLKTGGVQDEERVPSPRSEESNLTNKQKETVQKKWLEFQKNQELPLWEAVMYSCSAPTFFPVPYPSHYLLMTI